MDILKDNIFEIIKDYHCDECKPIEIDDITIWIEQFDAGDRQFVLEEFLHLLNQGIYVSKERAYNLLWENFLAAAKKLGYSSDLRTFVYETHFFNSQPEGKSQTVLNAMLNELVEKNLGENLNVDKGFLIKNFIYIDDVVATGKTALNCIKNWLTEEENFKKVLSGEYNLVLSIFAMHSWAWSNIKWIIRCHFNDEDEIMKKIGLIYNLYIDNQVRFSTARLNLALPINKLSKKTSDYFNSLSASDHSNMAFRAEGQPKNETFYSSAANRTRFESIILEKGIEILQKVKKLNPAHRPLGATYPNYKTLGTGTLFFTWRNISNTCPLIFWWDNPTHEWKSLFILKGRGN